MQLQLIIKAFATTVLASGVLAEFQDREVYARDIAPKNLKRLAEYRELHAKSLTSAQTEVLKRAESAVANFAVHDARGIVDDCEAAFNTEQCKYIIGGTEIKSKDRRNILARQTPECHCTDEHPKSDCDDGYTCRYKFLNCAFNDGCGPLDFYVCNGLCVQNI